MPNAPLGLVRLHSQTPSSRSSSSTYDTPLASNSAAYTLVLVNPGIVFGTVDEHLLPVDEEVDPRQPPAA